MGRSESKVKKSMPIAVTDSGIGGLSTLYHLARLMPNEDFVYFGDSANNPYGTKDRELVRKIVFENAEKLMNMGTKAIVVACNTATGVAVRALRETYPDFTFVGIEPAIKPAALDKESPTVAIMATPLTLSQDKFRDLAKKYSKGATLLPIPCPGLADLIEKHGTYHSEIVKYVKKVFSSSDLENIDSVVLGCTHYALIEDIIREALPKNVKIFDGSLGVARETMRRLGVAGLLKENGGVGTVKVINTAVSDAPLFEVPADDKDLVSKIIAGYNK